MRSFNERKQLIAKASVKPKQIDNMRRMFFGIKKIGSLTALLCLFFLSCKKSKEPLSSQKAIISFSLKPVLNPGLAVDIEGEINSDTIRLGIPSSLINSSLVPAITYTGKSISPEDRTSQNFSNPVVYTVTAADKSTRRYIVKSHVLSSTKNILYFGFRAADNAGLLTRDASGTISGDTVYITVDAVSVANLVPYITHNGKHISPENGNSNNFLNPVTYTVTAEDGSTKKYTVIVRSTESVFVGNQDGSLYALDAATGKLKWKYPLDYSVNFSPTHANGTVFIGNLQYLYALNAETGQLQWKTYLLGGNTATSPQVVNNTVYIAVTGFFSGLIAIDATTGIINWKQNIGSDLNFCNPTVAEGRVVTADFGWGLHCFDAITGSPLWTFPIGIVRDNAVMVNGSVFIGGENSRLVSIDAATGVQKWVVPPYQYNNTLEFSGVGCSPTVHNGVLYTGQASIRAYDTATGQQKWEYAEFNSTITNPVGEGNVIYATNLGDIVYALNTDGTLKWRYGTIGSTNFNVERPSATVAHGVVFTGCGINNKLIALNGATGQLIWSYESTKPFLSGPCVVDGTGNSFHSNVSGAQQ